MKRLLLGLSAAVIVLAGCSSQTTVRYNLTFNVSKAEDQLSLTQASMRVVERRLEHLGEQLLDKQIDTKTKQTAIIITVPDKGAADELTKELTEPFKVRIMAQTGTGETADITVDGQGGFKETGITEKDLLWVDARTDPQNGKGEVGLEFTDAGKIKMQALFRQMVGKNIGIFVRDRLVSKLHIATDNIPNTIVIRDIPSADVAMVFADDMNVGLHVTFTPVP